MFLLYVDANATGLAILHPTELRAHVDAGLLLALLVLVPHGRGEVRRR
jgi:hypothetical protein